MGKRTVVREQAARLQGVRDGASRAAAATVQAQQAAAAMERSVAMSRQMAVLQAQALLAAAASMEVIHSISKH